MTEHDDPYARMAAYLDAGTDAIPRKAEPWSIPADYGGTAFRSRLEAGWARTLDRYGIRWEYEPHVYTLDGGTRYLPDFSLPDLSTFIEAKGPHMQRLDKARELARQMAPEAIVLIGYPPQRRRLVEWRGESMLQWADALGYPATFTSCPECGAYQWCRIRVSLDCRACGKRLSAHHAACGEMPFYDWQDEGEPFASILAKGGASLMPWVRFDDQYTIHRKVDGLSDAAFRLHTSAIFWCARNLTDGFVSREDLDGVTARVRTPARFAAECASRGAWHEATAPCASEKCPGPVDGDGWVIHDYWQYQPTKAQVLADREKAAARQEKWRKAKAGYPQDKSGDTPRNGHGNGGSNGVTNGVANATPDPTRPEGSGSGRAPDPSGRADGRASPPGSPDRTAKPPRPPWCGGCDERTRLDEDDQGRPRRCPACHPLAEAAP
jgi:hypothetical protein